jgi:hypothetical protein
MSQRCGMRGKRPGSVGNHQADDGGELGRKVEREEIGPFQDLTL